MFTISKGDLWRGLVMAVLGAVVVAVHGVLGAIISQPGFDVFEVQYVQVLKDVTNASIVAAYSSGIAYLLKNMLTDHNKNFMGIKTNS